MKTILTALPLCLATLFAGAAPASADEPPAFKRSYESGVQVYRGHVPQTDLRPILIQQARQRQVEAARAQAAQFERDRIAAIDRQTRELALLRRTLAKTSRAPQRTNFAPIYYGNSPFVFGTGGFLGGRGLRTPAFRGGYRGAGMPGRG